MKYTFEEFIECEEKKLSESYETEKKIVGDEIHFCHPEHLIFAYQDITELFPTLMEQFPTVQFIYRYTFSVGPEKGREEIHLAVKEGEEPLRTLVATVWKEGAYIPPRLGAYEMGDILIPLATFEELIPFFIAAIEETPRYVSCQMDNTKNGNQSIEFTDWKEGIKKHATLNLTVKQENEHHLTLVPKQNTSTSFHFLYCEKLTKRLYETGLTNTLLGRFQIIDNGQLVGDEFRLFFYHQNQLMIMRSVVMEGGVWKGLKTDINYAHDSWETADTYKFRDLDKLKENVVDLVKEEPDIRLYVVTAGLNND